MRLLPLNQRQASKQPTLFYFLSLKNFSDTLFASEKSSKKYTSIEQAYSDGVGVYLLR